MSRIMIVPAEGDSVETEKWYAEDVYEHYRQKPLIFRYNGDKNIDAGVRCSVSWFFGKCKSEKIEIHAQGGFGAMVAYDMMMYAPGKIEKVFFIGGASSEAMNLIQRLFHRYLSVLWYYSRIPFFADDPNPFKDAKIAAIRQSSTECMRANPLLYRNQLMAIGRWMPDDNWQVPENIEAYFVPNGDSVRPGWWDNSYNNEKAAKMWERYGVKTLPKPKGGFSFYSLMPSEELFKVMDTVR